MLVFIFWFSWSLQGLALSRLGIWEVFCLGPFRRLNLHVLSKAEGAALHSAVPVRLWHIMLIARTRS